MLASRRTVALSWDRSCLLPLAQPLLAHPVSQELPDPTWACLLQLRLPHTPRKSG